MAVFEICMCIIGVIFILGSFMITEKMSPKELEKVSELTKEEMDKLIERGLERAKNKIDDKIDEAIEDSVEKVQRTMEKESNEKIMSITEYSDNVLETINKTHTEVMFLYSMLTDKEEELKDSVSEAQILNSRLHSGTENELENEEENVQEQLSGKVSENTDRANDSILNRLDEKIVGEQTFVENNNQLILKKHKAGHSVVQIAKELGLGQGEVKLVIDLYKGAGK